MMNGVPLTFLCYWGGDVLHPFDGPYYANGPKCPLVAQCRWRYNTLINKLYEVIGVDRRQFNLRVICRYPHSFDCGVAEYVKLPIKDDNGMEVMFNVSTRFVGMGSLQLYIDMIPIDKRHEKHFVSRDDVIRSKDFHGTETHDTTNSPLHTGVSQDHVLLDAKSIGREIVDLVKADPGLKIESIVAHLLKAYGKTVCYKRAWCGKQRAIAEVYGDWKKSYESLPRVLAAIKQYNPKTIVDYYLPPPGGSLVVFDSVFWAFAPCLEAFAHCRPVICVDGTFLDGRYKGIILIAMAVDANDNPFPLAFAIVEQEDYRNWHWFLSLVFKHVVKGREVCLISGCHEGILQSIANETEWQNVHHRFCLGRMRAKFLDKHKGADLKRLFWVAGYTHQYHKLKRVLKQIHLINPDATKWLECLDVKKWTLAYDGGYRYGIMTTNLTKVLNDFMKGARSMPITTIVETSFYGCVDYFVRHGTAMNAFATNTNGQLQLSHKIYRKYTNNNDKARKHQVKIISNSGMVGVYHVTTGRRGCKGGNVQVVRFGYGSGNGTCTCGKWDAYHFPCSHVIACCKAQNIDDRNFISTFYNLESYRKTWSGTFEPLHDKAYWNVEHVPRFYPNPMLRRDVKKGQPRSNPICNSNGSSSR